VCRDHTDDGCCLTFANVSDAFLQVDKSAFRALMRLGKQPDKWKECSARMLDLRAAGNWKMARIWNGDQTDYGLNLKADENVLL
jgi:Domain of unknown function (DUF5597)